MVFLIQRFLLLLLAISLTMLTGCDQTIPADVRLAYQSLPREIDFNFHVRPILADKCYPCHGPDEKARKGGLRLDMEEAAFRLSEKSQRFPIVKGSLAKSEAVHRVLSDDKEVMMPPIESRLLLSDEEKAILIKWVEDGALWKKHWSFIPPEKKPIPNIKNQRWPKNEIDYFILTKLDDLAMVPASEAPAETLIRRLSIDLTGLPPTADQVQAFLTDRSEHAYESLVDRLLESPHFGERWCWEWLDAARYADTNGFQGDPERKMWPWKDWVIRSLNENMPFNQFSIEQLAGDLLNNPSTDQILATAFNRNHMYNGEGGRIPEETRVENVFDRTETFGTVWLGLTLNCCRCHDHKFDALSQKEYYQLFDYFNQTSEEGIGYNGRIKPVLDLSDTLDQKEVQEIEQLIRKEDSKLIDFEMKKFPRADGLSAAESLEAGGLDGDNLFALGFDPIKRNPYYLGLLGNHFKERDPEYYKALDDFRSLIRQKDNLTAENLQVMVMDHLERPRPSYILDRGAYDKKGEIVTSATPVVLPKADTMIENNRLALANWLFSKEHPLTARVTVNRFWQAIFGVGLVKTAEDFGVQGARPTHPELLDWLAVEFRESDWNIKALIKMIVMSATYRQASHISKEMIERDPENKWYARSPRYRWPSWILRDQALVISGLINDSLGGPSFNPYQPPGIWEEATFGFKKYIQDHGVDLYRRSLYIFWRRIVGPTMFFDNAARQTCEVKPIRTNTPLQALTILNDVTYNEAARVFAERVIRSANSDEERVESAFFLATCRSPGAEEKKILMDRLNKLFLDFEQRKADAFALVQIGEYHRDETLDVVQHAAFTALCSIILNLDEVLTRQ
ncbi:MAG: PSD1 domain-containing protein [Saprospiraceae bacterium]|nr:PSD1 domain-containing protein [Saprospiraceae bacterium]